VDNAILAHRLCNRIAYSISVDRPYARDLERVRKAREEAIRRNGKKLVPDISDALIKPFSTGLKGGGASA
jgi:hypothetical protein